MKEKLYTYDDLIKFFELDTVKVSQLKEIRDSGKLRHDMEAHSLYHQLNIAFWWGKQYDYWRNIYDYLKAANL